MIHSRCRRIRHHIKVEQRKSCHSLPPPDDVTPNSCIYFFLILIESICWNKRVFSFFHFIFYQNRCLHYYNSFANITQSVAWISSRTFPFHSCQLGHHSIWNLSPCSTFLSTLEQSPGAGKTSNQAGTLTTGDLYHHVPRLDTRLLFYDSQQQTALKRTIWFSMISTGLHQSVPLVLWIQNSLWLTSE